MLIALQNHDERGNGITAEKMAEQITGEKPTSAAMRHIRHHIEALRREGTPVCGTPQTGYFLSYREEDINETCEWLYGRAMTTLTQVSRMKKLRDVDLRTQLGLPMETAEKGA